MNKKPTYEDFKTKVGEGLGFLDGYFSGVELIFKQIGESNTENECLTLLTKLKEDIHTGITKIRLVAVDLGLEDKTSFHEYQQGRIQKNEDEKIKDEEG